MENYSQYTADGEWRNMGILWTYDNHAHNKRGDGSDQDSLNSCVVRHWFCLSRNGCFEVCSPGLESFSIRRRLASKAQ